MMFSQNKEFFSRVIDESYVLLRQGDEYCFKLNESGGFLWESLKKSKKASDLAKLLSRKYSISEKDALSDVNDFLKRGLEDSYLVKSSK